MGEHITRLGAINKETGKYCCAKLANKKEKYICPECCKVLICRQGEKRIEHFAHHKELDPCNYYKNPSETQIHKDAKLAIKQLVELGIPIKIIRKCSKTNCSNCVYEWELPNLSKNCKVELEYRFNHNNSLKVADLAVLYKKKIYTIFEIYNSHITYTNDRPEPWFEFNAKDILNNINSSYIELVCIRKEECNDCLYKKYMEKLHIWLKKYGKEWNGDINLLKDIIKNLLELKFEDYDLYSCENEPEDEELVKNNIKIINLFQNLFDVYKVIVYVWKYSYHIYIVKNSDYIKYDYWKSIHKMGYDMSDNQFPYKLCIHLGCDIGNHITINIIFTILKTIYYYLSKFTLFNYLTKVNAQSYNYDSDNGAFIIENYVAENNIIDQNDVTNASTYRYMRYEKKIINEIKKFNNIMRFENAKIPYTECNSIITIIHPYTKQKIRRSLISNKTCLKEEWNDNLTLYEIITWYKSEKGILKIN